MSVRQAGSDIPQMGKAIPEQGIALACHTLREHAYKQIINVLSLE